MTAPLPDDPFEGLPTASRRPVVREIVGLLCVLVGLTVLTTVLATVDTRWAIGLGAVVLVAAGLHLGRGSDSEVS